MFETGSIWVTEGGWKAVVCNDHTVYHERNGGKLYSFNRHNGHVTSSELKNDPKYNLRFLVEYDLREAA